MIEYTGMLSVFLVVVVHSISASGAHMKGKGRKKRQSAPGQEYYDWEQIHGYVYDDLHHVPHRARIGKGVSELVRPGEGQLRTWRCL